MNKTNQPSRKKAMLTQIVGSYLLTAITIVQSLLLLPLYFKYIDYSLYGYWITIGSVLTLLSMVNFGIGVMTTQRIASNYAKKNFQAVGDYFINSLFLYICISIVFLILGFILSFILQNSFTVPKEQLAVLKYAYYIALFTMSLSFFSDAFRGFTQSLLNPLFSIYSTAVSQIISIVLIIYLLPEYKLLALPIGLFVSEFLIVMSNGIYSYIQYKKLNIKSIISKMILKEYKSHGVNLFGLKIGNEILNNSHPILITSFIGSEMTTAYSVTRKALDVILTFLNIINSSFLSPFSNLVGEGNKEKIKTISIKILMMAFLVSLLAFSIYIYSNHTFVSLWINKDIVLSQEIIFSIGLSGFAFIMTRLFRSILFGLGEIKFASNMVFLEGTSFLLLSTLFINIIGVMAIPLSVFFISSIISFILIHKILISLNIKISKGKIVKSIFMILFLLVFLIFGNTEYQAQSWWDFIEEIVISGIIILSLELLFQYKYIIIKWS